MTRWSVVVLAIALVLAALVIQLVPRYEVRRTAPVLIRVDRWTGTAEVASGDRPASWLHVVSTFGEALQGVRDENASKVPSTR